MLHSTWPKCGRQSASAIRGYADLFVWVHTRLFRVELSSSAELAAISEKTSLIICSPTQIPFRRMKKGAARRRPIVTCSVLLYVSVPLCLCGKEVPHTTPV